ncbi:hypothetical protein [Microscilla marina]|uniref:Outer membrane lipoprotein-sorting protein n=1 Tax=Microscilla marina ATCC 23134 TaxID=313606 RepID=A1ZKM2_MICM2|nr:hypothetical protein [Microscilla marina]EAY29248.1 hypothetical protein M23134_02439 [Microscilla marina ATCC 23134]
MKKTFQLFLFALLFLGSSQFAQAQTADDILEAHFKAIGGKDQWRQLHTITYKAYFTRIYMRSEYEVTHLSSNAWQMVDFCRTTTSDGKRSWCKRVNGKTVLFKNNIVRPPLQPYYLDYKKKGHKIKYIGVTTIEGKEYHQLETIQKNGTVEHLFFDTHLFMLRITKTKLGMKEGSKNLWQHIYYDDYKQVGNRWFFHKKRIQQPGTTTLYITKSDIVPNAKVNPQLFKYPGK